VHGTRSLYVCAAARLFCAYRTDYSRLLYTYFIFYYLMLHLFTLFVLIYLLLHAYIAFYLSVRIWLTTIHKSFPDSGPEPSRAVVKSFGDISVYSRSANLFLDASRGRRDPGGFTGRHEGGTFPLSEKSVFQVAWKERFFRSQKMRSFRTP